MSAELQTRLTEAETAYHQLVLGQGVAEVRDHNGELIRYSATNIRSLWNYIQYLRAELGQSPGGAPARAWF